MWGSLRDDGEKGESPEESKVWRELTEGGVNGIITENDDERERAGDFKGVLLVEYLYNNTALHVEVCVTVFNSTADFFLSSTSIRFDLRFQRQLLLEIYSPRLSP